MLFSYHHKDNWIARAWPAMSSPWDLECSFEVCLTLVRLHFCIGLLEPHKWHLLAHPCVTLTTPCLSVLQVIPSAHCISQAFITHQQQSSGTHIKGSLQMSLEALVSILHFKEYKDYLGILPWIGTYFSAFLVSAILHLNMASGFLLTENHIPSTVTRKGWGGVFLSVTEKHCLRNGNTALLLIQPLFLLLFSVKYNKNIVGKYIVNYLQWKGYTIHWQGFSGMEQRVAGLSCLSVYGSKTAEPQI